MKRKLLSLFLATLMVFSSVLPVFATEGEQAGGTPETDAPNNTVTLTYDDLYIDDAQLVFAWDAFDKKEGDAVGEGNSIVLATLGEGEDAIQMILTLSATGEAKYGDGYLEVKDSSNEGTTALKITGVYTNIPTIGADDTYENVTAEGYAGAKVNTYTTQAVMSLIERTVADYSLAGRLPGAQDAIPFSSVNYSNVFNTFGLTESIGYIGGNSNVEGKTNIDLFNELSKNYLAAANGDDAAKAAFRTPIDENTYKRVKELKGEDYVNAHVILVDATDDLTTNDPVGDFSQTGYECDWEMFSYLTTSKDKYYDYNYDNGAGKEPGKTLGAFSAHYPQAVYELNTENTDDLFNSGIVKASISGVTWLQDSEWKKNGRLWSAKDYEGVTTQTRINQITAPFAYTASSKNYVGYNSVSSYYADFNGQNVGLSRNGTTTTYLKNDFSVAQKGMNARYYAIRIYNSALTVDQMKQNHFADLCKFYALDLELLANIKANELLPAAADMLSSYELGGEDVNADVLNAKLAELKLPEQNAGDYADLYVTDGLLYRWDAYNKVTIDENGAAVLTDLNGGEIGLTLADAKYNGAAQYIETESAFDFSAIMAGYRNEDGSYKGNLEYELVLTQVSSAPASKKYPFPNVQLGPLGTDGYSGGSKYYGDSYGGMGHIYVGYMKASGHEETSFTLYYFKDTGKLAYQKWQDASKVESGKSYYVVDDSVTSNNGVLTTSYYNDQISAEDQAKLEAVTFKYHSNAKGVQVSTEDWATPRYFGNYLGEAYSVGGAITFHLEEGASVGSLDLQLYRDGLKIVQKGGATRAHSGIYYAAGKQSNPMATYYATKTEAEGAVGKTAFENTSFKDDNGTFILAGNRNASAGAEMLYGYHAFRVYTRTLTEAERMQNHFADLASYHRIDELEAYNALSGESKLALWAQFSAATLNAVATDGTSNTSFDDVTKEELEAAILAAKTFDEKQAALKVYNDMYVEGANVSWNAYHEEAATLTGTTTLMNSPTGATVSVTAGSSAAFTDGYLRLVNSSLKITNAYVKPTSGTANYTTELVYASYYDADTARDQINDHFFPHYYDTDNNLKEQANWPAFGSKQYLNSFVTLGFTEAVRYGTADSIQYLKDWSAAYAAASKNENGEQATFWTPISEFDYNTFNPNGDNTNFRKVGGDTGIDPIGAYSQTGYEANWEGFAQVLAARGDFYKGVDYALKNYEGLYNSYVLKTDINGLAGGWYAQYDYVGSVGTKGSWSSADFGEISTHTWLESIKVDGSSVTAKLTIGNQYGDLTYKADGVTGSKPQNLSADFQANDFNADYYAIRVYPFTLTAEERAQNHFADLAGFTKIDVDVAESYYELSEAARAALHAQFADTKLVAEEKATVKAAIEEAIAEKLTIENAFKELGAKAEDFYKFNGYQVHLYGTPALRADFEFVDFSAMEGVTLKQIVVSATPVGGNPMAEVIYENGAATGSTPFVLEYPEDVQEKDYLAAEWTYSATVTITYQDIDFTMQCDMSSEAFGDTVSIYEVSCHEALKDLATSKLVRSICEAE